jgi:uncharacterized damage-inducible protein DinB
MKEYLVHLIKYNQSANNQVIRLLSELDESERTLDRKSYYKSLHGLLDHIAGGALFFQRAIKASYPEVGGLDHKYFERKTEHGKINFPSFTELKTAIETLDSSFVKMVESLNDEDLKKTVTITHINKEFSLGVFIMQYANHGTHHRGQISQILDEMGIDNNFSNIAPQYN